MTLKMTLALIALAVAPTLAAAQCDERKGTKITASACGQGMMWDTTTQSCVDKPAS